MGSTCSYAPASPLQRARPPRWEDARLGWSGDVIRHGALLLELERTKSHRRGAYKERQDF